MRWLRLDSHSVGCRFRGVSEARCGSPASSTSERWRVKSLRSHPSAKARTDGAPELLRNESGIILGVHLFILGYGGHRHIRESLRASRSPPAFGRAVARSARGFYGTRERVPFRFGVGNELRQELLDPTHALCA